MDGGWLEVSPFSPTGSKQTEKTKPQFLTLGLTRYFSTGEILPKLVPQLRLFLPLHHSSKRRNL